MIRPDFRTQCVADAETLARHKLACSSVPVIQCADAHDVPLAVVGGGKSALEHLEELRSWPGHIWAINQTAQWLASEGRSNDVWLFSISPTKRIATYLDGVNRAILSSQCHPDVFQGLAERGADVRKFHLFDGSGPASAPNAVFPSAILGYKQLTFFGCEGSFKGQPYFYRQESKPDQMVVRAGGVDYVTSTDIFITTEVMASVIKEFPERHKERSGGLLRAMIQDPEWGVVAWSESLRNKIAPQSTERYEPAAH